MFKSKLLIRQSNQSGLSGLAQTDVQSIILIGIFWFLQIKRHLSFSDAQSVFIAPILIFLLSKNGEDFKNAWGEKEKAGALSSWEWNFISDSHAEYTEAKWVETEENAQVVLKRRNAIRV